MLTAHEVKFDNGVPMLSEGTFNNLLERGFREGQIKFALDTVSREMVKKALKMPKPTSRARERL